MRILGDRLLLSPLPVQEISNGGIHLPAAHVGDFKMFWKVDEVGPGLRNKRGEIVPPEFKVGDTVITPLHFSHFTMEDGTERKIVTCDQILGILEPEPAPS